MKRITILAVACLFSMAAFSQKTGTEDVMKMKKDSTLRATYRDDSIKIEKEFAEAARWEKMKAVSIFPVFNAGEYSGVIPVPNATEIPDPNIDYKLLFELTAFNPDSTTKEMNYALVEVARIINLHVASGIPVKKIIPVIVVHAGALRAFTKNDYYKDRYKTDNPNIKLLNELTAIGAKFIACGQAMNFINLKPEALLPEVKISLTAQTVLSSYQLKGFVKYDLSEGKR